MLCCVVLKIRWPQTLNGLRSMERLLKSPTMRERYLATCVGEDAEDGDQLRTWSHSLTSLRWEALVSFCTSLLAAEPLLRRTWRRQKFMGGTVRHKRWRENAANSEHGHAGPTLETIDKTIADPSFWSGVSILADVAFEAEFVGRWCEGCPCGCTDPDSRSSISSSDVLAVQGTRRPRKPRQTRSPACPYKGCRAAELAAGTWSRELRRVMSAGRGRVNEVLVMSRASDRADFFDDWTKARSKLWAGISVKLAYFQQLPWRL